MPRRRYVSTEISVDRAVNRLGSEYGDFAALLYTWMIPHAGEDCSLTGDPEEILMLVVPGRRDRDGADVAAALDGMRALGLILDDPVHPGRIMFPPSSFYRYQSYIKPGNRRALPLEPAIEPETVGEQRETPQNSAEQRASAENAASVNPSVSVPVRDATTHVVAGPDAADAAPAPAPTADRAIWSAFGDALGTAPSTKAERGKWNQGIRQLRDAGITAEHVPRLVASYRDRYGAIDCNPMAVAANLSAVRTARAAPGSCPAAAPVDLSPIDELARELKRGKYRERPEASQ